MWNIIYTLANHFAFLKVPKLTVKLNHLEVPYLQNVKTIYIREKSLSQNLEFHICKNHFIHAWTSGSTNNFPNNPGYIWTIKDAERMEDDEHIV